MILECSIPGIHIHRNHTHTTTWRVRVIHMLICREIRVCQPKRFSFLELAFVILRDCYLYSVLLNPIIDELLLKGRYLISHISLCVSSYVFLCVYHLVFHC